MLLTYFKKLNEAPGEISERLLPLSLRVLFWTTILLALASRGIAAHIQGVFVPESWAHHDWIFFILLASYIPVVLAWLVIPWGSVKSAKQRSASLIFIVSTIFLMPVLDFGHYFIIIVSVAHSIYAHNLVTAFFVCLAFGLANFTAGVFHPGIPFSLAAANGVLLFVYSSGVLIVSALLISASRRAQQTKKLLKELVEAHRKLRHYSSRIRELAVEEERTRMAREMHDSTGHYLTAIKLCLTNAQRSADTVPEELRKEINDARRLAGEALAETRRWVRALKPLDLENFDGPEALRGLTSAFGDMGVSTRFRLVGTWPDDLDGEVELALYRTVQEGLTNALRHSQAHRIDVGVTVENDTVAIEIADDGIGMGAVDGDKETGFGLSSLEERFTFLGGILRAGNRPEGGFRLFVRVPCRPVYPMKEVPHAVAILDW